MDDCAGFVNQFLKDIIGSNPIGGFGGSNPFGSFLFKELVMEFLFGIGVGVVGSFWYILRRRAMRRNWLKD